MSRKRSRPMAATQDARNGGEELARTRAKLIVDSVATDTSPTIIPNEWIEVLHPQSTKTRIKKIVSILKSAIQNDRELQPFELDSLDRLLRLPHQNHEGRPGKVAECDRTLVIGHLEKIIAVLDGAPEPTRPEKSRPPSLATAFMAQEYKFSVEHNDQLREFGWGNVPPDASVLATIVQRWFPDSQTASQIVATKKAMQRWRRP